MNKIGLVLMFFLSANSAIAGKHQFVDFADSMEKQLLFHSGHILEIAEKIKLKKLGRFSNPNAEATYTPFTNTIALKGDNLVKIGRYYRIKSFEEFAQNSNYNPFSIKASTIFHEMAHGDFDVHMERDKNHPMYKLLMQELPAWFKRHKKGVNAKTATHELFGYTAGEFVLLMENKIQSVLNAHGVYHNQEKCFGKVGLEKIAKRLELDKILEFKDILKTEHFLDQVIPGFIFINGKDIDVRDLPERYKHRLYNYFSQTYNLPKSSTEMIQMLKSSSYYSEKLKRCYKFLTVKP